MSDYEKTAFRMYDIRGKVGTEITEALAYEVGLALGTRIRRAGGETGVVGGDIRHSTRDLKQRLAAGLAETGLAVQDLGQVPTPVVYHALHRLEAGGGVAVTGSHNPKSDNGLKMCLGTQTLWGDQIASLRTQIEAGDFEQGDGSVERLDYLSGYREELAERFRFNRSFTLAVDCGNGVAGPTVVPVLEDLGHRVIPLYCEPDGDFPNHLPDPEVPKYMADLQRAVIEHGADCGLGFDGDGDRVGVIDEQGRKISADWLVALFSRAVLKKHPGKVRYDVKCSDFLAEDIRSHGGEPVMGETGHSLLKRDLKELDAVFGGELSGHIVFNREYLPIDDALYCALFFLELLEESGGTASSLFGGFPELCSTAEIKVPCPDARKVDVVSAVASRFRDEVPVLEIDGARVSLGNGAWFLVRASNTTPNLTVRFEAPTAVALIEGRDRLKEILRHQADVGWEVLDQEVNPRT